MTKQDLLAVVLSAGLLPVLGCAPSPSGAATGGDPEGEGSGGETTEDGTTAEGEGDDTSALLVDMVAPRICSQLRGSFVGLPGEGGHAGAESGIGLEEVTGGEQIALHADHER